MRKHSRQLIIAGSCLALVVAPLAGPARSDPSDSNQLFGCSDGAVEVRINRQSGLHFVRLDAPPPLDVPLVADHPFQFARGPLRSVVVHVASNGPEDGTWHRAENANFALYVEIVSRRNAPGPEKREYWKLSEGATVTRDVYEPGVKLICHGALDVSLAADAHLPILHVSYTQDLGGANADNMTENHLLLDFRAAQPRVLATSECGYNEGGGACTAFDSGQRSRANLRCSWQTAARDFLCSEAVDTPRGHSEFFLLNEHRQPPLRPGEVATIADAAVRLGGRHQQEAVVVRGVGPVRMIRRVRLPSGADVVILGSPGRLHAIRTVGGRMERSISLVPRALVDDQDASTQVAPPQSLEGRGSTLDGTISFSSSPLHSSGALSLLQIVARGIDNARSLLWLGIEDGKAAPVLDALTVASERQSYVQCGRYAVAAAVVAVRSVDSPFLAAVDVQPRVVVTGEVDAGGADGLVWGADGGYGGGYGEEAPATDCLRTGEVRWISGKGFASTVDPSRCVQGEATQPRYVRIDQSGTVTLSTEMPPETP